MFWLIGLTIRLTPVLTPDYPKGSQGMVQSTRTSADDKPPKPYDEFPLFAHATKRWAKKIKGKLYYFGPWADSQAALNKYLEQKDDLYAGRKPRPKTADGAKLRDLCNRFLNSKRQLLESGELVQRTFTDYKAVAERLIAAWGADRLVSDLTPADFESLRAKIAKKWGPVPLGNELQRIRCIFKFAFDAELIDKPVRFGPGFKRPTKKTLRKNRNEKAPRMFEAREITLMLAMAPSIHLEAMVLLGVNCGYGNSDIGNLEFRHLDLKGGWANFPRPKTGVPRRCPLWPITVEVLKESIAKRKAPQSSDHDEILFVTKYGGKWSKTTPDSPIAKEFGKLCSACQIEKFGAGFYALRHTTETIGGASRDQVAVDAIMGHERPDMASHYRERIDDDRLLAVSEHIRKWLFRDVIHTI